MILVTGATGFIGRHLLDKLTADGAEARCLTRAGSRRALPSNVQTAPGDYDSGAGIPAALEGVDTVIHLAGVTKALDTAEYYRGNARATETLARAAQGRNLRFVHVSSLAAIGPSLGSAPVGEDEQPRPLTNYGKSKLESERIVRAILPGAVIVRPPVVYGPRDTDVFQLLQSISRGLVLEIAGGERWFSAIYVEDLVEGILLAARRPSVEGRTYFLTHAKPASWSELSAAAADIMQRKPKVLRIPIPIARCAGLCAELWARLTRKPGIISREKVAEAVCAAWICDHRRAAEELGFHASTGLRDGLLKTLAWYKEAGWLAY